MKTLYAHQARFLAKNPDRALLLWEVGTGKTLAACEWLKKRPGRKALVVCPKALVGKWKRDLVDEGAIADVMTRDEIKKSDIAQYKCLVLDEAHDYASPLFSKARSQRATKVYNHLRENEDTHVLLLTATPIRSTPWNIHTLACYLGILWPVKKFRDKYEHMTSIYGRMHYELNKDWRIKIREEVEAIADIVLLKDCADVPKQHKQVITIPWTPKQENEVGQMYLAPAQEWHEKHRRENSVEKFEVLQGLLSGYRKAIVICYYTAQIEEYSKAVGKERQVFVLQGSTKNQDEVIANARATDDCVFFVQASMGNGFDAHEFSVMIFASQSFKFIDNIQSRGRILRMGNLHENTYIYLLGGKCDRSIYETIEKGHDFHAPSYMEHESP